MTFRRAGAVLIAPLARLPVALAATPVTAARCAALVARVDRAR